MVCHPVNVVYVIIIFKPLARTWGFSSPWTDDSHPIVENPAKSAQLHCVGAQWRHEWAQGLESDNAGSAAAASSSVQYLVTAAWILAVHLHTAINQQCTRNFYMSTARSMMKGIALSLEQNQVSK